MSSNVAGSTNPHPLLENNEEKNRLENTHYRSIIVPLCVEQNIWLSSVVIKVGMVGDSQIGKTSLMVKYVEGSFDEVWTPSSFYGRPLAHHAFPACPGLHSDARYGASSSPGQRS